MAIAPKCEVSDCGRELGEFGAILLGPPDAKGLVKKQHVCTDCYKKIQGKFFFPSTIRSQGAGDPEPSLF